MALIATLCCAGARVEVYDDCIVSEEEQENIQKNLGRLAYEVQLRLFMEDQEKKKAESAKTDVKGIP